MNVSAQLKKAFEFLRTGNLNEAEVILKKVLSKYPLQFDSLVNCGFIQLQKKNLAEAKRYFYGALEVKYDSKIVDNLAELLRQTQSWDEIIQLKDRIHSSSVVFELNYAIALRNKNNKEKSLEIFEKLLEANPKNLNIYIAYGFSLNYFQMYEEAISLYQRGLNLDPENYFLNYNLGIAYSNNEDQVNSIKYLQKSITKNDNNFDAWITLAAQQVKLRKTNEAMESIQKCKGIDPENNLILFQTAVVHMKNGNISDTKKYLNRYLELEPHNPDGNFHMGLCLLFEQNFKEAPMYYRYRVKTSHNKYGMFNDIHLPEIKNDTKIIIGQEQGIGDQLLFLRLLPSFVNRHKNTTYITTDKLFDLLKNTFNDTTIIKESECDDLINNSQEYTKINIGSLLHYEANIKNSLQLARDLVTHKYELPPALKNKNKKIGLSWSSVNKSNGKDKSLPLIDYAPILNIPNLNFISLQYGDVIQDIQDTEKNLGINLYYDKNLDYFNDISKLSALIKECDYVVTTSNVTAHLAGSLGVKTFVLVPKSHGKMWYWFSQDDKCIWYPSIQLIHQSKDGFWDKEIYKIKQIIMN